MKNIVKNASKQPDFMGMEINGVKIQLRFVEKEELGVKDRVIEILSDAYKKRRLGETSKEEVR